MGTFKKPFYLISSIILLGFVLRLVLINQSLWYDESINVYYCTQHSFWSFVSKYPVGDFHPPLYFAVLWIVTHLFGYSEIIVRLPSVIFGVMTVGVVYLLGKNIFNQKIGLISALLLAVAPLHIYYSQEARMYSLATLVVCLSFYFFERIIYSAKNIFKVGFVFCNVLLLYSDYLPYLIFPAQFIFLLIEKRGLVKQFIILYLISFLSILVWVPVFLEQVRTGTSAASMISGWKDVVGNADLKGIILIFVKNVIGRVSLENKYIYGLLVIGLGLLYGTILGYSLRKIDKNIRILVYWIVIPPLLAFLISFYIPVLSYFRLLFIWPAFLILIAKGLLELPKRIAGPLILLLLLISFVAIFSYFLNPSFQREDWRGLASFLNQQRQSNIVLLENNTIFPPLQYYQANVLVVPALENVPVDSLEDIKSVDTTKLYLLEYLIDINDPKRMVEQKLNTLGYQHIDSYNFSGVGILKLYQK